MKDRLLLPLCLTVFVLISSNALAQGNPNATRFIPYEGTLDIDGVPVNAVIGYNFALFGCADPDACTLWTITRGSRGAIPPGRHNVNRLARIGSLIMVVATFTESSFRTCQEAIVLDQLTL